MLAGYYATYDTLTSRLAEPAPGRIQLLTGPRQVGKTTMLLNMQQHWGSRSLFLAADAPEAALQGWWEVQWQEAFRLAADGPTLVLIDEIPYLPNWSRLLKAQIDLIYRLKLPIHVVVTGSAALSLNLRARETMAGRFERLEISHWPARDLSRAFGITREEAIMMVVRYGSFPGAVPYLGDIPRWLTYLRESIIEPALFRDIIQVETIRLPALLRQVYAVCVGHPAEIISLKKIVGELLEQGSLPTVAHYLQVLQEAYLIATASKYAANEIRRRAAPPKVIPLTNAFLAARNTGETPTRTSDPRLWGHWVENACLAYLINNRQSLHYWREDPLEVDAVTEGSWGRWAIEIKTGGYTLRDLQGVFTFVQRNPSFRPLLLCDEEHIDIGKRAGVATLPWQQFLWDGVASVV